MTAGSATDRNRIGRTDCPSTPLSHNPRYNADPSLLAGGAREYNLSYNACRFLLCGFSPEHNPSYNVGPFLSRTMVPQHNPSYNAARYGEEGTLGGRCSRRSGRMPAPQPAGQLARRRNGSGKHCAACRTARIALSGSAARGRVTRLVDAAAGGVFSDGERWLSQTILPRRRRGHRPCPALEKAGSLDAHDLP
jgi:hypothetical protein